MLKVLPTDNLEVRQQLYKGALYQLPSIDASRDLVKSVWAEVQHELGEDDLPRTAQFLLAGDEFFTRIGRLRKHFYTSSSFHRMVTDVISEFGFDPEAHAFDPIRLRVISHRGEEHVAARPMYYGHRDTWYGNPQSMITWWIPLHDVCAEETFEFFPDEFARPVANDSEIFDFDAWTANGQNKRIGWQDKNTGRTASYPQLQEPPQGTKVPIAGQAAQVLLFSAQQLHQTIANHTGRTRFSIDFRTVHLGDHINGLAPTNVDNRSTGSSLKQFLRLADE